jgi:hypothetical protein
MRQAENAQKKDALETSRLTFHAALLRTPQITIRGALGIEAFAWIGG